MKKSYYCEKLEKTLHFLPDGVKYCCSCTEGIGLSVEDFQKFSMSEVINNKNEYIKMLRNGEIPNGCMGCCDCKELTPIKYLQDFFSKNKISHIIIDHFKQCDCNCIYCAQKKLFPNLTQNYELLPIIKNLYKENLIDNENLKVEFQGGNVSLLKEFDDLMQEFKNNNCKEYVILSNLIKYIPQLEALNYDDIVTVYLDSGTEKTFEKIKQVNAFNIFVDNLKKLRKNSKAKIHLKYIIIHNVNDNIEEVQNFLNIVKEIMRIHPVFEIDYNDTLMSKGSRFEVPKHYYDIIKYIDSFCKTNSIEYSISPTLQTTLDKGYSD